MIFDCSFSEGIGDSDFKDFTINFAQQWKDPPKVGIWITKYSLLGTIRASKVIIRIN
jgi:hypothetical protein